MKTVLILVLCELIVLAAPVSSRAVELLSCVHVVSDDQEHPAVKQDGHVDLAIDGTTVLSRITVPAAEKTITFRTCSPTRDDGSDFSRWFGIVCRDMKSLDGSPYYMDVYFYGAYAGISRRLTPADSMWKLLREASRRLDLPMPQRTFVLYAESSPVFEFFCSSNEKLKDYPAYPDNFDTALRDLLASPKPALQVLLPDTKRVVKPAHDVSI